MASSGSNSEDVFDVRRVRRLVELMQEFELAEIDLRQAEQRIRLRKDQEPVVVQGGYAPAPMAAAPAPAPAAASPAAPAAAAPAAPAVETGHFIVSPMVGTFYVSSSPDSPAFVKIGDQVGPETVVCIVEAMKVFNELPAECSGKIVAVLVENGAAVEYGQKLFRVEK
ncbi:acetyl-CoA carboxylase biotin carboxyl carrier protein [Lacipirellula parvula]|uniref:Biotin carboxyl carrier protein of acetyl-CoA carboxylase n=1 Tax=Lacipirellula parvula TaxID=2650471 RepID=A0A5K7XDZ6_9BACT|nr:acetyl-CoA carboxylase biotin carboxyl carrier protein [Lacipirellula parvula]BBO35000.1 biotin carboxyl carrier protein of acetyl-CoA carboxylase [Lacipirellula parvula]